jgi:cob(I)alamin adenosyltransferase
MVSISTQYVQGASVRNPKNYLGFSEVFQGERIPKSSSGCDIHASVEFMRIALGECIHELKASGVSLEPELCKEIASILDFLFQNAFNFSSFAFTRGVQLKYAFGAELTEKLQQSVQSMNSSFEPTSFISFANPLSLSFDRARVSVRKLEQNFVAWMYSDFFVKEFFRLKRNELLDLDPQEVTSDDIFNAVYNTANYLNTLSEWLFTVGRYLTYELDLEHHQWERPSTYDL